MLNLWYNYSGKVFLWLKIWMTIILFINMDINITYDNVEVNENGIHVVEICLNSKWEICMYVWFVGNNQTTIIEYVNDKYDINAPEYHGEICDWNNIIHWRIVWKKIIKFIIQYYSINKNYWRTILKSMTEKITSLKYYFWKYHLRTFMIRIIANISTNNDKRVD